MTVVDVHGSCVSRDALNLIEESKIKVKHYFSRNNIASSMMPPASFELEKGALIQYTSEYSERCMRYALNKKNIAVLLESDAEFLIIDFFDFCQPVAGFQDTTFSTYDYTFYNTTMYKEHVADFFRVDFMTLPHCLWYGYVDAYFKLMIEKFKGKVILNRLNCSRNFLDANRDVKQIPDAFCHFGSAKYNEELSALEDYIIKKYPQIYVTDLTKYFIPDYVHNPDTTPVHYEEYFNVLLSQTYEDICLSGRRHYCDVIPPKMVGELLNRPVSTENFMELYLDRELPFCSDTCLDFLFTQKDLRDVATHRMWIASLYQAYADDNGISEAEVIGHILATEKLWLEADAFIQTVNALLKGVQICLQLSVHQLYQTFLEAFENDETETWIMCLNVLAIVAPGYENVPNYLMEYYMAMEDTVACRKVMMNYKCV